MGVGASPPSLVGEQDGRDAWLRCTANWKLGKEVDEEFKDERKGNTQNAHGYGSAGQTRTDIRATCSSEQRPHGTPLPGS